MAARGTATKLKHMKERTKYGQLPISDSYLDGMTREEYTAPWDDHYKLGLIYVLHKYTPKKKLTMRGIGEIIGWDIRAVKMGMEAITKKGILRTSIQKIDYKRPLIDKCRCQYYMNNAAFSALEFKELLALYYNTTCHKQCNEPNACEQALLDICNEIRPNEFRFNGARLSKNRVGNKYPDIAHIHYPIVIEHFGSTYHHDVNEEIERIDYLNELGYHCCIVWDYEVGKDHDEAKEYLKEFIDNAIQDIQQLVI